MSNGCGAVASGPCSFAEGSDTQAVGFASHAEGCNTTANGPCSHAEGAFTLTTIDGAAAHAEGAASIAMGIISHAEGSGTTASGLASHSEGISTTASGDASHAEGISTTVLTAHTASHIMGENGSTNEDHSWFLVNNGIKAKISGNTGVGCFTGGTSMGPCDYAELFETLDGEPIDVGYFVTLTGKKIRKAGAGDRFILGITSATPGVLGNSCEFEWMKKYLTDEWGREIYREVVISAVISKDGKIITPKRTEKQLVLNPEWSESIQYVPRSQRPEWVAVGLLGQLRVRDDGTCQVDEYCRPNEGGIATASNEGYRVIERTGPNQVLVLFR